MANTKNNTSEDVRASVASIYSDLLSKRRQEKEAREEKKRQEEELKELEKESKKSDTDEIKLSKKERRQKEFDNWKEVVVGLAGDDLEYSDDKKKSKKKKYSKWIDDENESTITVTKKKKSKKRNYNKEFSPELQMLKTIVADQNKFTQDLQKRFNTMAGPATKDAMPPNKTMVELASVINAGRSNSLGVLKEIGNLKKVIAELYFKQHKEDAELGNGGSFTPNDLALMGSGIASSLFADEPSGGFNAGYTSTNYNTTPNIDNSISQMTNLPIVTASVVDNPAIVNSSIPEFDPSTWDGPSDLKINPSVAFETIPHSVVVEMNKDNGSMRFKAINDVTGEELEGCPVPTYDTSKLNINEKDLIAKGQFDETYKIEIK